MKEMWSLEKRSLGEQGRVYNPGRNFSLIGFRVFSVEGGGHFGSTSRYRCL